MWLSADLDPLASVLPSYVAGVLAVVMVYLHGRVWRGGGMGLTAALLVGFNQSLLLRMQEATPTTLAVACAIGALLCYGWHQRLPRIGAALALGWADLLGGRRRPVSWPLAAVPGGIRADRDSDCGACIRFICEWFNVHRRLPARARFRWLDWVRHTGVVDGLLALAIALLVALPWHMRMFRIHGWEALTGLEFRSWGMAGNEASLLVRLIDLAPVTLPMGIYGAARAIRSGLDR